MNIQGQLSDRTINKNIIVNYFNKDITDNIGNEEIHPKVVKIAKKMKNI